MLTFLLHQIVEIDGERRCGCGDPACKRAGKHPSESWKHIPADRPELVPTAERGVGIATGARSGIFVVDLDTKHGVDGAAELAKLGPVPPTYAVATPSGGFHLYFKHPGFVVRNSGPKSNPLALGVDVRGDSGYVVAPGSPHANGGRYEVAANLPIAEAPAWLLADPRLKHAGAELAQPVTEIEERFGSRVPKGWRVAGAKAWLAEQEPAIERNGGDGHTFKLLVRAVHEWCLTDPDMVADAFVEWNARCEPPWGGREWAHKVDSALHHSTVRWNTAIDLKYADATRVGAAKPTAPTIDEAELRQALSEPLPAAADGKITIDGWAFDTRGLDAPLPPLEFQIAGLICKGDVVMFVAQGNSLKTWLSFSIALAVATGRPWLNRFVALRGRVGILDYESGEYEVKRRLKMLGGKDGDNVLRSSYSGKDLADPEKWITLAKLRLDLLIIDSFHAASPGVKENDAESDLMLQLAGRFAEITGCTVIFIHHSRKGSGGDRRESVRGSTALFAACDRIFEFDDLEKLDGGAVRTTLRSIKDGAGRRPEPFRVELSDGGLRYVEAAPKAEEKPTGDRNRETILSKLKENPAGVPKADLLAVLVGRKEVRLKALAELSLAAVTVEFRQQKAIYVMLHPAGNGSGAS